jgi:hypothetical protein
MMSTALTPPQPGGSGTKGTKPFSMTTWNIRCGRGLGMAAAAKGLAQMGGLDRDPDQNKGHQ